MAHLSSKLYAQSTKVEHLDLPAKALAQAGATTKKNLEVLSYGG